MKTRLIPLFLILMLCITAIAFSVNAEETGMTYLSDLKPKSETVGWSTLQYDKGLDGNKLSIAGETFEKGLCAHAPSELNFDISEGGYTRFTAAIGLHNGTNNGSKDAASVKFTVQVDDKVLYESGVFKMDTPAEKIDVALPADGKILTLITTDASDGNSGDHSAWADAKLYTGEIDMTALKTLELTLPEGDLLVGDSAAILPVLTDFAGNEIPLEKAKVTYTSTDPAAMSVDKSGKVVCKAPGSTVIHVSATVGEITIEESVTLRGCGSDNGHSGGLGYAGGVFVNYSLDKYGALRFSVNECDAKGTPGEVVVPDAAIGIVTTQCDFSDGLIFVSEEQSSIDESYTTVSGKRSTVRNQATVTTLVFEKAAYYFTVEFRAYPDGFGYRYTITRKDGIHELLTVTSESGWFALDGEDSITAISINNLSNSFNHEAGYSTKKMSGIKSGYYAFPVLCKQGDDRWMLLSEAELYNDVFIGSVLHGIGDGKLQMQFAPKTNKNTTVDVILGDDGFTSPWRFGIVGTLGEVVESDLTEKLCERTTEDFSWVEPGVTAWMWLSEGFAGQRDKKTVYEYIDLAHEMGWKYLILDEGWQPNTSKAGKRYDGYYSWFDDMIKYAANKGVGIIAWVLCNDLDTPEEREVLQEWADKGIKGIKVDFFDSEDNAHIGYYKEIYDACAKAGLIVNCHGANKPTGERMMWPNIINREAVNGEEYGGYGASDLCTWPFIRNVVGPMDLTPRMNPSYWSQTTVASQMAMNVVFECGIPCMGSAANEYLSSPAKSFYQNLPAAWDDIHFVEGDPGKYAVIARRSGDNWYVGGISSGKRTFELSYDFLEDGATYMAFVYKDGSGKYDLQVERKAVTKADRESFSMFLGSGFAVKLIKVTDGNAITGIDAAALTVSTDEMAALNPTLTPADGYTGYIGYESADPTVATVDENGTVTGLKPGKTEITICFIGDKAVSKTVTVTVTAGEKRRSDVWSVHHETVIHRAVFSDTKENGLVMETVTGDSCGSMNNVWNIPAPKGDFTVTVSISSRLTETDQTAGLVLFSESNAGKTIALARRNFDGNCVDFYTYEGDYSHHKSADKKIATPMILKLERKDGKFLGSYSYNGAEWIKMGTASLKTLESCEDLRIGIYAGSNTAGALKTVTFTDFTLNGDVIPFAVAGDAPTQVLPTADVTSEDVTSEEQGESSSGAVSEASSEVSSVEASGSSEQKEQPADGSLLWLWITLAALVLLAGVAVCTVIVKKKKKQ